MKSIIVIVALFAASVAHATEVRKAEWVEGMRSVLPTLFCQEQQYFRQCFDVTAQECEETAISATRICLNTNNDQIPEMLKQPEDGSAWGRVVGTCAGQAYEIALIKKRIDNEKCNNVDNWR